MPSIDVQVTRGGRAIGVARSRPLRITPHGRAGIVYKGRVHEVRVSSEGRYFIDTAAEFWSNELKVCPLATFRSARRLLEGIQPDGHANDSIRTTSIVETQPVSGALNSSGETDSRGDGPRAKNSIDEIIELLMPHTGSGKVG